MQLKKALVLYFLCSLTLVMFAVASQSAGVAYSAIIFISVGACYLTMVSAKHRQTFRDIQSLFPVYPTDQYTFVGQVKVTKTPSGGRSDIHDDFFFLTEGNSLKTLTSRSTSVIYLAGLPLRELYANGPKKYILCASKGRFFLWKQL